MKTFLGLPVYKTGMGMTALLRHSLSIILFTGLGYFFSAMVWGTINGDIWKHIEPVEQQFLPQLFLLLSGVILGNGMRVLANKAGDHFFHYSPFDKYFYPVGFAVAYMVINELFGL